MVYKYQMDEPINDNDVTPKDSESSIMEPSSKHLIESFAIE